jgi:SAM-dependent methyltransferase
MHGVSHQSSPSPSVEAHGMEAWRDFMIGVHQYEPWDQRPARQFEFLQEFLSQLPSGARVLDVGAGQCELARFLHGYRYVGVDLAVGDKSWDYSDLDAVADVQVLPLATGSFDGALNLWVVEHVRNPPRMIQEVFRVLRPSGLFLMFAPFVVHEHQAPHDYYRFTRHGVRALLEDAGFTDVTIRADSSYHFAMFYEAAKYLLTLQDARGLPPDWAAHLRDTHDVLREVAKHCASETGFDASAGALSFMGLARKPARKPVGGGLCEN